MIKKPSFPSKKIILPLYLLFISILILSCITPVNKNKMVPYLDPSTFQTADTTVFIAKASGANNINIERTFRVTANTLRTALYESLKKYRIFQNAYINKSADYELRAEIISQKIISGFTVNSILFVSYRLIDTNTNKLIWNDNILSQINAYGGDQKVAVEGTVRDNIAKLLKKLSALEL